MPAKSSTSRAALAGWRRLARPLLVLLVPAARVVVGLPPRRGADGLEPSDFFQAAVFWKNLVECILLERLKWRAGTWEQARPVMNGPTPPAKCSLANRRRHNTNGSRRGTKRGAAGSRGEREVPEHRLRRGQGLSSKPRPAARPRLDPASPPPSRSCQPASIRSSGVSGLYRYAASTARAWLVTAGPPGRRPTSCLSKPGVEAVSWNDAGGGASRPLKAIPRPRLGPHLTVVDHRPPRMDRPRTCQPDPYPRNVSVSRVSHLGQTDR